MLDWPLLSLITWLPIIGAVGVIALGRRSPEPARVLALVIALVAFVLSLLLYIGFDQTTADMQFVEKTVWIEAFNIHYHLGIDGISLPLILLNTLICVLVVVSGWNIKDRAHQYMGTFLILHALMSGMFAALDIMLFYAFFEAMLVPMFLIIGMWGGPNRIYATVKFFLFTFFGSVFLLIAMLWLYHDSGSFSVAALHDHELSMRAQTWLFLGFLIAFAVKVPMWPVHTWLPDAHVEAPTGGSVVLAAVMLKIGGYGLLRYAMPIAPDAAASLDWLIIGLSLVAIIYISLVAIAQSDMKKLIAYSSIAHMGFVTLGMFLVFAIARKGGDLTGATLGMTGAMVQMVSHGFISAAMFLFVGILYDRVGSREISAYGGVGNTMPWFGMFTVLFFMANSGLPGTSGFVGEFTVIIASFHASFWISLGVASMLLLGAAYSLWLVKRVLYGPVANDNVAALKDLDSREWIVMTVLAVLVVGIGFYPLPLTDMMQPTLENLVEQVVQTKLP